MQDAAYNGQTLIGNITGSSGTYSSISVIRNEVGSTYGIATFSGSTVYGSLSFTTTQLNGASTVAALITASGTFVNQFNSVSSALNTYGSATNYVNNQVSYNNDKIDALNTGLGALVDANLAQELALSGQALADQAATRHAVADPGDPDAADPAHPGQGRVVVTPGRAGRPPRVA